MLQMGERRGEGEGVSRTGAVQPDAHYLVHTQTFGTRCEWKNACVPVCCSRGRYFAAEIYGVVLGSVLFACEHSLNYSRKYLSCIGLCVCVHTRIITAGQCEILHQPTIPALPYIINNVLIKMRHNHTEAKHKARGKRTI